MIYMCQSVRSSAPRLEFEPLTVIIFEVRVAARRESRTRCEAVQERSNHHGFWRAALVAAPVSGNQVCTDAIRWITAVGADDTIRTHGRAACVSPTPHLGFKAISTARASS